jgi:hypothetical protein
MATNPTYASTPRTAIAQISAANTGRDGTGTLVDVIAGAATGTRVDDITIIATGTTTAGMVRLFLTTDAGTTNRLLREVPVTAVTPSGTVQAFSVSLFDLGIVLPNANTRIRAATNNAETFNVIVTRAGDF